MSLFHIFILAVIQGVTEFLPISSSGHLAALPVLFGFPDQGLTIDVAVHVGTLFAVIVYFWRDVRLALFGTADLLRGRLDNKGAFLALCLIIATIPATIMGFFLHISGYDEALRSIEIIGWTTLIFGFLLLFADKFGPLDRASDSWTLKHAFLIGLSQMFALIPGTSRSGVTITAARALGYNREGSARIAMLMSIPIIIGSGVLKAGDALYQADAELLQQAGIAAAFAFVAAFAALALMMRLLKSVSFTPYVLYRIALGGLLLGIAYST